jgi:MFS family permease
MAGGILSQSKGWRWVFWVLAIVSGTFLILSLIFMRETYGPIILRQKTRRLRKETGNEDLRSKFDVGLSPRHRLMRGIVRPTKILISSPIVLFTSVYVGVVYGYLYLLITTFTVVFENTYHFSSGSVGLTFLGLGVGSLIGLAFFVWLNRRTTKKKTIEAVIAAAAGQALVGITPEDRLPMLIPGTIFIPVGLLLYGWTANYHVHWIVPIISTSFIGIGNMAIFLCISIYLIDAFTVYSASALAANTVIRSVMGAVLPLAGQKIYNALGLGWGNSLLAFVALAMSAVPLILIKWGEPLRKRFQIKYL